MSKRTIWVIVGIVGVVILVGGSLWAAHYLDNQQKIEQSQQETEQLSRAVDPVDDDLPTNDAQADQDETTEPVEGLTPEPSSKVVKTGSFRGHGNYRASGNVEIIQKDDQVLIQLQDNFEFSGAPDPVLYLGSQPNQQSIDSSLILGQLEANSGQQAYQVSQTEFATYGESVIIWCRAFEVYMGGSNLS